MRKLLLTLTTVGMLAVPAGMALAQSDTTDPTGPVPTCVDQERARDRDRDRTADQAEVGAHDQQRTRTRLQEDAGDHVGAHDGDGVMYRWGTRAGTGHG